MSGLQTKQAVITAIRAAEPQILAPGGRRLALFGSVARDEATKDSDVDLLVEFAPGQKSFDRFNALYDLLESILNCPVEIVTTDALSPYIGPHILAEATDVLRAA
jgi:predicted nucleotidyltransferase